MDYKLLIDELRNQNGEDLLRDVNLKSLEFLSPYISNLGVALELLKRARLNEQFYQIPKTPDYIVSFFSKLLIDKTVKCVLDPWANIGEMLNIAHTLFPEAQIVGHVLYENYYSINKVINPNFQLEWGYPIHFLLNDTRKFDLIISNLPINLKVNSNEKIHEFDDLSYQIIIDSLLRLEDSGTLIATVSQNFFNSSEGEKLRDFVAQRGFSIKSIFGTPTRSIYYFASVPVYYILIGKGEQKSIFQANITLDHDAHKRILKNFKTGQFNHNFEEGIWITPDNLQPVSKLKDDFELRNFYNNLDAELVTFSVLGTFKKFRDLKNEWLIIPENPNKKCEYGLNKPSGKSILIFEINSEIIDPTYLLEFLNSSLGNRALKNTIIGAANMRLTANRINEIIVPIYPIVTQREIVSIGREIKNKEEDLQNIRFKLWKKPDEYNSISIAFKQKLSDAKSFEWIEVLPFPISSILWGYYSEINPKKKAEYLGLFFEGLCEFFDILLISTLLTNKAFFETETKHWLNNAKNPNWFKKSSFGGWRYLYQTLSKNFAKLIKDENIDMFVGGFEFFNMLTSEDFVSVFNEINTLRNDFKGHGGISSAKKDSEILSILENKLYVIQEQLIQGFRNVSLFRPLPNSMDWDEHSGIYSVSSELLTGTRTKFMQMRLKTNKQISSKKIYLKHEGHLTPVEILPLVQMRESPISKQIACYFYNKVENEKVRFVSYHYEIEEEIFDDMKSIESTLSILKTEN